MPQKDQTGCRSRSHQHDDPRTAVRPLQSRSRSLQPRPGSAQCCCGISRPIGNDCWTCSRKARDHGVSPAMYWAGPPVPGPEARKSERDTAGRSRKAACVDDAPQPPMSDSIVWTRAITVPIVSAFIDRSVRVARRHRAGTRWPGLQVGRHPSRCRRYRLQR